MRYLMLASVALALTALGGCAALNSAANFVNAIAPTPHQQCVQSGGKWRQITTYDQYGNPNYHDECVNQ